MVNQAALDGWVKSIEPKSGRAFYANHLTRVTQWDAPSGWNEESDAVAPASNALPEGWEEMKDPSTGRSFYVDHERQITTWTKPTTAGGASASAPMAAASPFRSSTSNTAASTGKNKPLSIMRTGSNVSSTSRRDRSWSHDASYFRPSAQNQNVDFSDSLSHLDFKVQIVEDKLRPTCASCNEIFTTISKRRHHCRLCGDVYCHDCSNHRALIPLEGPEFEKPVRICDACHPEVEQGNFFSLRRYLTPLTLYEPPDSDRDLDEEEGVATHSTVAAALSALTSDLDALIHNGTDVDAKLANTSPDILVPAITKHLVLRTTSDRAVRALASLLTVGSMVQQTKWALAILDTGSAVGDILTLLERSGSDRRTLYVQEQAAKTIFYLSDAQVMKELARRGGDTTSLDIPRSLRAMLDHSSNSKNPNLQRWAASSIRHLVCEDERRTTSSANDIAATMAVGRDFSHLVQYESFLPELINTGGILILCSLIGADDSDTRAHATGALGATLDATRAMNESLATLYDMTGGQAGRISNNSDGDIIRSIVQGGGCGNALSQLLLSAENGVARMGCDFCASLVMPLLEDARGTATLDEGYNCQSSSDGLGAYREAALAMASGSVLTALLGIMRNDMGNSAGRPMALKKTVMETLAAIAMAVGEMTKANPQATEDAVVVMLEEGIVTVMLAILESSSSQTLSMTSKQKETPSSRIRESAGIVVSAMAMCSADAMMELQSCHAISAMLAAMSDITGTSTLRGDGAPKCLGMLQTAAALLTYSQHDGDVTDSDLVDRLLEAVDAGAISTLSRILFTKVEWDSRDKAVGAMKARDAACRMLTAMFGMARTDTMAHQRLWDVVDADAYQRNPPRNIVTGALGVLQAAGIHGRNSLLGSASQATHYHAAVMDLVESSLYAVGSMCGSTVVPGLEHESAMDDGEGQEDAFSVRRKEASAVACDILTAKSRQQQSILPTMLVGGFGEKTLTASLRLALAIAQHGNMEQHAKLAGSGIMVPISDLLKSAMSSGDQFRFSACLALVRYCGPHVGAGQNANGGLSSVQAAIRTATHVLAVPVDPSSPPDHIANTEALKAACIQTLESLSSNASLWSAISKDALPSIVSYLHSACDFGTDSRKTTLCGALRAIARIVGLQSHAVSAARAGLAEPLGRLLIKGTEGTTLEDGDDELPLLALEVLHVLTANKDARKAAGLLESGVIEGVCCALGKSATATPKKPSDGRADICFWSIEILHYYVKDLGSDFATVLQSPMAASFMEVIAREPRLIKAFCSTLLVKTSMTIPKFDADSEGETLAIPKLYGPPLVLVQDTCSGFDNTHSAAMNLFFSIVVLSCAMENSASDSIWETILLANERHNDDAPQLAATLCAHFLKLLSDNNKKNPFIPLNAKQKKEYEKISCPLVRHALLEGLKTSLGDQAGDFYMISMLVAFEVPRVCLTIWQDPNLVQLAFGLIRLMVDSHEEDLVHIFVESKETLLSLFDMLNASTDTEEVEEIRSVVASILGSLAGNGLLTQAVEKFDIKSAAIGGLASACLAEEPAHDENEDRLATSATLSSRCMECLVDLLKGKSKKKGMQLGVADANSIASRLGQKICRMVISRFIERAKLSQYDVDDDDDVMDAPDVKMLCAMAQHESALKILSSLGGISALALVAGEGELSAIVALKKADSSILLDSNGHQSIMKLVLEDSVSPEIETAALELLAELSLRSKGRNAIVESEQFVECIQHALHVIGAVVEIPEEDFVEEDVKEEEEVEVKEDSDDDDDDEMEESEEEDKDSESEEMEESDDEEEAPKIKRKSKKVKSKKNSKENKVVKKSKEVKATQKSKEVKAAKKPKEEPPSGPSPELKSAAISFLSNLVAVKQCRTEMLRNSAFIPTLSEIAKKSKANLQGQSIRLIAAMAPFATVADSPITADSLAETLIAAMQGSSPNSTKEIAAEGLTILFHGASPDLQSKAMEAGVKIFQSSVKKTTIARSTESAAERASMAKLACSLASLVVQVSAKEHLRILLCTSTDLLKSMIHLIEWRYDTKGATSTTEEHFVYWDAAVSFSIQHLATVICGTLESQEGLNVVSLTRTVLTVARPGKAPRKTCDFKTALERVIASKRDATGAVSARRILATLIE
jgi:hypothetical protein